MKLTVEQIEYHRNGVCGVPFHVVIAKEQGRNMLIVRFDKKADKRADGVLCAAFDLDLLSKGDIRFGQNSWRGDWYAIEVDKAIRRLEVTP